MRCERGQATVEWLGLLLVTALVLSALLWLAGMQAPGTALADAIVERLLCAVALRDNCARDPRLELAHGGELAAAFQAHAPTLLYEPGMRALPVDFRRCRADSCAEGAEDGTVARSQAGLPIVAFTHAIDCRRRAIASREAAGADCSDERAGNLYLQYWFYYPGSATAEGSTPLKGPIRWASAKLGHPTFHADDWESYQVRLGPAGAFARASSHHGYSYRLGGGLIAGYRLARRRDGRIVVRRPPQVTNGWGPEVGTLYVSGGSHAGNARVYERVSRTSKDRRLRLIPLRWIALEQTEDFAVTPPWRKRVYFDPEYGGTD
jgi:hypothetical protein